MCNPDGANLLSLPTSLFPQTFTRWANLYLMRKNIKIEDLYVDFEDGFVLGNLLQIISNGGLVGETGNKYKFSHDKKRYKVNNGVILCTP